MKIEIKDYSLISNKWIDQRIEYLKHQIKYPISDLVVQYDEHELQLLQKIKEKLIPSINLASAAYDAGTKDSELSQTFDNVKARFINSKIEL